MTARAHLFTALLVVAALAACSSKVEQPPTQTEGTNTPPGGGGGGPSGGSSSGAVNEDGGVGGITQADAGDAGSCLSGGCLGCCTSTNVCLPGNQNTYCGLNGQFCINCVVQGGTGTCANQQCE